VNDYLLGRELTLVTAPAVLGAELSLSSGPTKRVDRSFYDTFDGRLRAAGMVCVAEGEWLTLVHGDWLPGREIATISLDGKRDRLLAIELPDGAMRAALIRVVDVRALALLARVRSRIRTLAVLDDEQKTVVRIAVEQPAVVLANGRDRRLPARLRLAPVRGYDKALERTRRTVEETLGLHAAPRLLLDEAVGAAGGTPGGVTSKVETSFPGTLRADAAAAAVLRRLLEVMHANLPGTVADVDAEFLHDFRVALRRSRAVQRELRRVFPASALPVFRTEFRWLQQATGNARDLDVYVLEFNAFRAQLPESVARDLDPLLGVLRKRRTNARRAMVRALQSDRTRVLLDEWGEFLAGMGQAVGPEAAGQLGPDSRLPIRLVAGRRITRVDRRMVRMGEAIDRSSPAEDYHELRKQGKELRYLLELFATPLYPEEVVKPMVRNLKALQDTLGRHQDREIQVAMLRSLGDDVAVQENGAAGLMAMGMLVERLEADLVAARAEFAARFAAFAAKAQRSLVRDTFR
jgi:CHAD domain-containing protein